MRAFGTLLTLVSIALSATAAPVVADIAVGDGSVSVRSVDGEAVANLANTVVSKVEAADVLNSNVEQTQHHRRNGDVDADGIVKAVNSVVSGVKTDNVLNHNVKQTQRDFIDVDALIAEATAVVSEVNVSNVGNSNVHQSQRRDEKSLVTVVLELTAKLADIHKRLLAVVDAKVDINVVLSILAEAKAALIVAVGDVKFVIANYRATLLELNGKIFTTIQFAKLLAVVVELVVGIVTVSITAVGAAKVYVIAQVTTAICVQLSLILELAFSVVVDLLVDIKPLVEHLAVTITGIKVFASVVAILKLN